MTVDRKWRLRSFGTLEFVLMALVIAGLIWTVQYWRYQGWVPAPFVFDINDTFMDWFHTAKYAHNPGAYDVWRSVYPPISFVFLRLVSDPRCYGTSPFDARDCDVLSIVVILTLYAACAIVAAIAFYKNDRSTAFPRSVCFAICLPLLYALERGNLLMVSFIGFVFAFTNIVQSRTVKIIAAAITINFKYYLLTAFAAFIIKRSWRDFELIGIATLALYLLTLAIVGSGTPFEILYNLRDWVIYTNVAVWDRVYYSTTFNNLLWFDIRQFPVRDFAGSKVIDLAAAAIPIVVGVSQFVGLFCLLMAWLRPSALSAQRVALLALLVSMIVQSPGGYAEMFLVFLIFMEKGSTAYTRFLIVCGYLISIPADYTIGTFKVNNQNAWLSGRTLEVAFGFNVGAIIRPGLLLLILWALIIDSLIRIARAPGRPLWGLGKSQPQLEPRPMRPASGIA